VERDRSRFGPVLETFVYAELLKHSSTANGNYQLLSYRDSEQVEVDIVAENTQGQIVGIEVKASATVRESDFKGLKKLAKLAGDNFTMGLVLYDGTEALPMGDKLWAAPLASLWGNPP
jgi:predicted AAA+ superfamily ATPase